MLIVVAPHSVQRSDVISRRGRSPFEGDALNSRIAATWVYGLLAWDGSAMVGDPAGHRHHFNR